jgi:hypothetical protein
VVYNVFMEYYPFSPESRRKNPFETEDNLDPEKKRDEEELAKAEEKKPEKNRKESREEERARKRAEKNQVEQDARDETLHETISEEQAKHDLAKEYLAVRSAELRAELDSTDPDSPKIAELQVDLKLLEALDLKLNDPDIEVDPAAEAAYQQIMAQLEVENDLEDTQIPERIDESPENGKWKMENGEKAVDIGYKTKDVGEKIDSSTGDIHHLASPTETSQPDESISIQRSSQERSPLNIIDGPTANSQVEIYASQVSETIDTASSVNAPRSTFETPKSRVGSIVIAGAVGAMLSKSPSAENSTFIARQTELLRSPEATNTPPTTNELAPTPNTSPERRINPIKRNIAEKERSVREFALKQALVDSAINNEPSFINPSLPKVESSIGQQTSTPLEQTSRRQPNTVSEKYERPQPQRQLSHETIRNVDQSSTEELLRIANSLRIDGVTVRQLYERNQIDHHGLKTIIKTALRGGDIARAFEKTKLGHEAIQGRKIEMRHDDPAFIPADIRGDISDYSKRRVEKLQNELNQNQSNTHGEQSAILPPSPEKTPSQTSYENMNKSIQKKRIATITITTTLALSGASALAWLLLH